MWDIGATLCKRGDGFYVETFGGPVYVGHRTRNMAPHEWAALWGAFVDSPFSAAATLPRVGTTPGSITILSASEKLPLAEAMSRLDAALPYQPEIATPTPEADRIAALEARVAALEARVLR